MAGLVMHTKETACWHALVNQAQAAAGCTLDEELERYLVLLLLRLSGREKTGVPVSDGSAAHPQRLQSLGDDCLLYAGLFADQAAAQELPLSYFVETGRNAYGNLASVGGGDLFWRLSERFVGLMDVLQRLRELGDQHYALDAMSAYDLWQMTGSRNAWRVLTETTGGIPVAARCNTLH